MAKCQPHHHVFLSHDSRDKSSVEPLAAMLRKRCLPQCLNQLILVPREPIDEGLIEGRNLDRQLPAAAALAEPPDNVDAAQMVTKKMPEIFQTAH